MYHLLDTILNGPAHFAVRHHFSSGLTLAIVLGALLVEFITVYIVAWLIFKVAQNIRPFTGLVLRRFGVGKQEMRATVLELTFPNDTSKSAFATEQLHILLRSVVKYRGIKDKLTAYKKPYSLEIVATHNDGIRYIIKLPTWAVDTVQRTLLSFLSGLKVRVVEDYLDNLHDTRLGVAELRLAGDFVLPLQDHKTLVEHDPVGFLAGHMTKLAPKELIAYQIVAMPILPHTHHRVMRHIRDMRGRIALGKEVSSQLVPQRPAKTYLLRLVWYPPFWVLGACFKIIEGIAGILGSMFSREHDLPEFMRSNRDKKPADNPYELELGNAIKAKLDQPLFEVSIRILVAADSPEVIQARLEALVDSFQQFSSPYQAIVVRPSVPVLSPEDKLLPSFRERSLSPHLIDQQTILSSSELSDLYHFPETDLTKTESLVKSRSAELPVPLSMKHTGAQLDVVVGVNKHGGDTQPIGMTIEQRQKHTYVIGKTGTGKTTLLKSAIYQDMLSGKGLAVLDPHGDMFQELLALVPEHRLNDVVVFDPADRAFPLGLNLLDPGIEFADEDDKQDRITSSVLSVFQKLADEGQWGPRMEHILRNATMTALQVPNPSLFTLQRLLTEKAYQKEVAETLKDPVLKQFWDKEFRLLGTMQLSTVTAPLTNRLGKFITSKRSRHILLQEKTTLRVADIMNEAKILLVNLSKGQIGEDQSNFFGTILTSFIWMAAYQRTEIPEKQRRDFFLYVDEFQNFASPDFSEIVSEGRKYHISLVVSHQNIAQIPDMDLLDSIAGNASTIICLKVGPKDEAFILPYMKPEVARGDIVNLAPYHFYMKTTHSVSEDAFSGQTVPLEEEGTEDVKAAVIAWSRQRYGKPKATVEAYLETLFVTDETNGSGKSSTTTKKTTAKSNGTEVKVSHRLHGG